MYAPSNRRGQHRKRLSALRLSSDTTVSALPVYTSPPGHRHPDLPEIPSDQPPAYPDSAEEADEDTDSSDCGSSSAAFHVPSSPPSLPVSPRRARRSQASSRSTHRRQQTVASPSDPYLDALLARSVHALEMSNALLQSSMSTQSSLSAVLADDSVADRHLEEHAQRLTSQIRSNKDTHQAWMDDLEEITRRVDGLVRGEDSSEDEPGARAEAPVSQSLPTTSGFSERMQQRSQRRRASQDSRQHHPSESTSNLQLSAHDRSHFVAAAPRALTMYIDSSEAADAIALPSTLGIRADSRPPPTPLPNQGSFTHTPSASEQDSTAASTFVFVEHPSKAAEMLASYAMPRSSSVSSSPSSSSLRRRSSSSSTQTVKRPRMSKSPPPALRLDASSSSSPTIRRSRSNTPIHGSPAPRQPRCLTPPIEELSSSSASSQSATLHVDRTVESLRQILEKQRSASQASGKGKAKSLHSAPPLPRPSLLSPPVPPPVAGTSNTTASISRLFTKPRHNISTRAPSPPKQSSMKSRSAGPSTPVTPAMPPLPSPSLLSVPSLFGLGDRTRSGGSSSGASTPKRISFAEPAESYSSTKPEGSSSKFRATKTRSKSKSAGERGRKADAKGKGKGKDDESEGDKGGWWTSWLLGAAGVEGAAIGRARSEERYAYASGRGVSSGGTWAMRPGFGGGLDEWGA